MKELKRIIREFINIDNAYYNGKLTTLIIVILLFLLIGCFILGFIIFD